MRVGLKKQVEINNRGDPKTLISMAQRLLGRQRVGTSIYVLGVILDENIFCSRLGN